MVACAGEGSWTVVGSDGRGGQGDVVELTQRDMDDDLRVEVHTDSGLIASGTVPVADLWAVRLLTFS
jgi:hypothetical protein